MTPRHTSAVLAALVAALLVFPSQPHAEEQEEAALSGLEIMRRSDQATRSATEHTVMEMKLVNSRDQERVRKIEGWSREVSEDEEKRFARFLEPGDVKDTSLLTYDYDENDDDIWLYLPALKKIKRILSSNKTDYFMGSDFTYWDMENVDLLNWDYELLGAETVDGVETWKVAGVPKTDEERKESGYTRTVTWIGKADFLARKSELHDKKERHAKSLTASDIRPVSDDDPRPRAHVVEMSNLISKHRTTLTFTTMELDVDVDEKVFSQRNLRQ
ncbi:MAG: hypothetical protein ACI8TX_001424 [Hyphomicrobiaceae bacterium]|jgi:hypothetical protein